MRGSGHRSRLPLLPSLLVAGFAFGPGGLTGEDAPDLELAGDWHYQDLEGGLAEARKTGRPLLVVFRCVP